MQKSIVRFPSHATRWALVALAFVLALLLAPQRAFGQACEDPKVLRFSIIPTQESVRELTLYKPVLDLLSKNTGKKIEFYMPTSYSSVVEALLGKWVDVAVLGPESYLIAKSQGAVIDVFATYYKKAGRGPGSRAGLQVDPDHEEGLEVHERRFGQGLGDAAGRSGQHLGLADSRVDLRRQGRQDAAEAVLQQGRVLRRARPVDACGVRRQGRPRVRRDPSLHERAHRKQGQDEARRLQHPVDARR